MRLQTRITFFFLIIAQGLHSFEEYVGKLWEVFAPARFLCGLVAENLETGFLIINIGLFVVGLIVWALLVYGISPFIQQLLWFWVIIETVNGIGHSLWSLSEKRYTPGVATSTLLLILAIYLGRLLLLERNNTE